MTADSDHRHIAQLPDQEPVLEQIRDLLLDIRSSLRHVFWTLAVMLYALFHSCMVQ